MEAPCPAKERPVAVGQEPYVVVRTIGKGHDVTSICGFTFVNATVIATALTMVNPASRVDGDATTAGRATGMPYCGMRGQGNGRAMR